LFSAKGSSMQHCKHQLNGSEVRKSRFANIWQRILFALLGIGSTIWFLVRVIPKPSRATYPCMKVAAPLASSFIVYLMGLSASLLALRKAHMQLKKARYGIALLCAIAAVAALFFIAGADSKPTLADGLLTDQTPNQPVGTAMGIFPGRVVWVHDPAATNENAKPAQYGSGWFLNKNNSQYVIDNMVSTALRSVTGQPGDSAAWDAIFKFHNKKRGKGEVGYKSGEKILIKINATSAWSGNFSTTDLSALFNSSYGISETSPQMALTVLRHLVKTVGVAEKDIYIGDPMKHIYKHSYDLWYAEFPKVNYLDHDYGAELGRVKVTENAAATVFYSDKGQVLGSGFKSDKIYSIFSNVEYLINLPTMKAHSFAGITMFAKNHFGSHTRSNANHLHKGLVAANDQRGVVTRGGYGIYRVQVDLMGHKELGGKNLLYLMDALWSSDYEIGAPVKWKMMPFNNDWTSSIFLSLDPVAIESVGYDFLHTEFTASRGLNVYPQMSGVDDYLHQAASSANWPAGISYDPESDGTPIASLGVHEHWNNSTDKQYTGNLGTGSGIELVQIANGTNVALNENAGSRIHDFKLLANYPNPFNASTTISYQLADAAQVDLSVYTITGRRIRSLVAAQQPAGEYRAIWDGRDESRNAVATGAYIYQLRATQNKKPFATSHRMLLVR
jgi:hypothetical protein